MYHRLWADWYLPAAMPALERLFFSRIPPGARVLDLCCGSGHVTKELVARGYNVVGVDVSARLLEHAREELPNVDFQQQDARDLRLNDPFDAVLCTFDSLNHMLSRDDLARVFAGVNRSLSNNGLFVFDMNLEEAYSADLHQWAVTVDDLNVTLVRGAFERSSQKAATELIWFQKEPTDGNLWRQHRSVVEEHCYPKSDIVRALRESGFSRVESVAAVDAGMESQLGFGRYFFCAKGC
ncbi:MAG: class I SAM-dependent methyltransferase [Acidobacteriaceae bacterium]|nr:class I SAM-dependent methyltransferase [Acidobacteriaceae bacterium]